MLSEVDKLGAAEFTRRFDNHTKWVRSEFARFGNDQDELESVLVIAPLIIFGSGCLALSGAWDLYKICFRGTPINSSCSKLCRVGMAVTKLALGLGGVYMGMSSAEDAKEKLSLLRAAFARGAVDRLLDFRELAVKDNLGQEYLELNVNDTRGKALFLNAYADHNFAWRYEVIENHLKTINDVHDIRYKVISKVEEICLEISKAASIGPLQYLAVAAHGTESSIQLTPYISLNKNKLPLMADCFKGLAPDALIVLQSCSTGKGTDSIASVLSRIANRTVWAPNVDTYSAIGLQPGTLIPTLWSDGNIWTLDTPLSNTCKFSPDGTSACGIWAAKLQPFLTNWIFG